MAQGFNILVFAGYPIDDEDAIWKSESSDNRTGSQMAESMERLFSNTPVSGRERQVINDTIFSLEKNFRCKLIQFLRGVLKIIRLNKLIFTKE